MPKSGKLIHWLPYEADTTMPQFHFPRELNAINRFLVRRGQRIGSAPKQNQRKTLQE